MPVPKQVFTLILPIHDLAYSPQTFELGIVFLYYFLPSHSDVETQTCTAYCDCRLVDNHLWQVTMGKNHRKGEKKIRNTPMSLPNHHKKKPDAKLPSPPRSQPVPKQKPHIGAAADGPKKERSGNAKTVKHKKSSQSIATKTASKKRAQDLPDEDETSSSGSDSEPSDNESSSQILPLTDIAKSIKQGQIANEQKIAQESSSIPSKTPSLTSDSGDDSEESTNTLQTQVKEARSSSPAKAKLKEAVASHKSSKRFTDKLRGDNVLNARSVGSTPVASGSNAIALPGTSSALSIESTKGRKPFHTSEANTKAEKHKPEDEKTSQSNKHNQLTNEPKKNTAIQPSDAVEIPIPKPPYGPRSNSAQVTPEEQKAAVGRIAQAYGPDFAARQLSIQPFRTFSSCAFAEESSDDDEQNAADNYKTGKSSAKLKEGQKKARSQGPSAEKQRKSTGSTSPRQGTWDDVLVEVKTQREVMRKWKKSYEEKMDELIPIYGKPKLLGDASSADSSEATQNTSKKRKRDEDVVPEADEERDHEAGAKKLKKHSEADPITTAVIQCDHVHIDESLLNPLKALIPETVLDSTVEDLKTAEAERIEKLITKNQRKEAKQLSKGKIKNPVWQDVDAQMAIENGLVEETRYSKDDAEVVIAAAINLINKISAETVVKAVTDVSDTRDTSGRRDASNLSEVEMQLSMSCMQKNDEIQKLRAELKMLKAKDGGK